MRKGVMVALTLLGLYFARQGVVVHVVAWEPLLVKVNALNVLDAIQMNLPFPEGDLKQLQP